LGGWEKKKKGGDKKKKEKCKENKGKEVLILSGN